MNSILSKQICFASERLFLFLFTFCGPQVIQLLIWFALFVLCYVFGVADLRKQTPTRWICDVSQCQSQLTFYFLKCINLWYNDLLREFLSASWNLRSFFLIHVTDIDTVRRLCSVSVLDFFFCLLAVPDLNTGFHSISHSLPGPDAWFFQCVTCSIHLSEECKVNQLIFVSSMVSIGTGIHLIEFGSDDFFEPEVWAECLFALAC